MAYDENGNYFFDPNVDIDDAELYHDEVKRQQVRKVVEAQQKHTAEANDFNTMWNETLKEEGIDQQAYAELYNADPQAAKVHLREAMRHVAKNVSRGRDSKGRYTKQQTQGTPGRSVQQRREQASPKSLDSFHETVKKRPLTHEEEISVIDALFDTDAPL